MAEDRWQRTLELFHLALEAEPEARDALLTDACGADVELRQAVDRLLEGHHNAPSFLDHPEELNPLAAGDDRIGQTLGPYRLEELLGEGGMGVVYRASQERPIRRQVALKLIQLGMATREVVARFESERQALAVLDHPNIAKVFDAGASEQGSPYFVMELVDGVAINRYCDQHTLGTRQRLELFMQVCRAVHHAHQKGIIHRDLKPSNVLVARHDGEPVPKVIDFGVARAIDDGQPRPALTQHGRFIGTPEYMSPEQAEMAVDVDIRTDVYSLGVMLYELLVGRLPIDAESLRRGTPERLKQLLRGSDTQPPSTRVNTLGAEAQAIASRRRTDPAALRQTLRGDLDWIVMRALEPEPHRRYGTASELAEDLARHLRDEPVEAGPPEMRYRLGKFVKRHRVGVAVAASIAALLIAFSIVTLWQAVRLQHALEHSEREARKAQEVTDFLTSLFQISDPSEARGNDISAREILDRGAGRVATELAGQPEVQAAMMGVIGEIYVDLGLLSEAESLIVGGLELQQQTLGGQHPDIAASHARLSNLRQWQDDLADAEVQARRALEVHQAFAGGADGDGESDSDEARYLTRLGSVLHNAGKYQEAEATLRRALELWEPTSVVEEGERTATRSELSITLKGLGRFGEAEGLLRQAIDYSRNHLGADHPRLATQMLNLASVVSELDRNVEAEALLREALEIRQRVYGNESIAAAVAMNNLARICQRLGKRDEAEALHREVIAMRRRLQGSDHSDVAVALANLGVALRQNGQYEEAEALYREALALNQRILGPDHPTVAVAHHNLSVLLRRRGRLEPAESEIRRAIEIMRPALGEAHPHVARSQTALGKILLMDGRRGEAEAVLRAALKAQVEGLPTGHRRTLLTQLFLGQCLADTGRFEEAEPLLVTALDGHREARGPEHEYTREAIAALVALYDAWNRPEDAARYRAQLAAASAAP
ncbi:MAG: serine/threonine-protein kinase [Acidobacteriota bacterium]